MKPPLPCTEGPPTADCGQQAALLMPVRDALAQAEPAGLVR